MSESKEVQKLKYILLQISKSNNENELMEVLQHSEFIFENHWNQSTFPNAFNVKIKLTPDVYTKNFNEKSTFERNLKSRINASTELMVDRVTLLPDYDKIELINSNIIPIVTQWEEINQGQNKLIQQLDRSKDSIDFQNIGNSSRTLMDKLARIVFNPDKHKPSNPDIKVNNGMFKNQLHSYLKKELEGAKNKEFRKLSESSIDFVEKSIDLMNTATHKLEAKEHLAEMCIINTIGSISLIKLVNELN